MADALRNADNAFVRQNLEAYVAMIIVNLPLPPLPVLCLRGDDNEDSFVSSHDLLSQAITATLTKTHAADAPSSTDVQERKSQVLAHMHRRIQAIWATDAPVHEKLEDSYAQFADTFRAYMAFYPGSSDLRIAPVGDVSHKHPIYKQACQHLAARIQSVATDDDEPLPLPDFEQMTYPNVIKQYALDLCEAV